MNIKKITQKLSQVRDDLFQDEKISKESEEILKSLLSEPLKITEGEFDLPEAHNDNQELTADQYYRLRLMEKTGTGSHAIH